MAFTVEFFTFLTFTAVIMVHHCKAALPPPTDLSYEWVDAFTVNVTWKKPSGLQDGKVWYKYCLDLELPESYVCVKSRNFSATLLTEETGSSNWTYFVWTVEECNSQNESTEVRKIIQTPKPRAEVKDIKCIITRTREMNCSWIPGNPANMPLKLSYRICGLTKELIKPLRECNRPYIGAGRYGCYLTADGVENDTCVSFETDTGMSTSKIAPMIDSPVLSVVKEEGDKLKLSWVHPKIGVNCSWTYTVCYKKCSHSEECHNYTTQGEPVFIPYDKSCRYEFWSSVKTDRYCKTVFSECGEVVSYGTNDEKLTVVAIVLPIILSVCIFLSCYCFRRHSSIICPVIPDPSAIFKEMMMNGNKELKTTAGSLYTPVPEPIESCKVDPVTDNLVVPLNS
ncbi:interleukin-13 receptor subunit alpha-1-like [Anarrhichthys ocellatus]|uniref:interleukin-13 receptor subunit alpha-1-like n=1 Tax=Anarrhichthys ocellatus TaxID=433405 RepID=UPI0012EE2939|nr:interleukin-13 receptor subunit alpha-1-like [Anarrhichthys ocellatus]